ncbi:uncharacterized protein LY79DRAFT_570398 [Colletotrichum navitas]|uniref:Uncharacterized protein n=1 Tax=Colletotrichum navitas TaxID=681940 RepID=A0AAD8PML0_9PEZI|nr:uncharacterized protein LY79DRAFT_570398 [Colletotrichum navitas]KAK1570157.1 hypothetical protein LY79DRAFT_570398 [Colletotrichum navitas]
MSFQLSVRSSCPPQLPVKFMSSTHQFVSRFFIGTSLLTLTIPCCRILFCRPPSPHHPALSPDQAAIACATVFHPRK